MKKWIFLLLCIAATVAGKAQSTIVDSPTLRLRINLDIVPNNNGSITATKLNNLLNGALNVEGNLLKTKVDSVWVVGRNIYVRKGSNTYNYLLTAVYDSTVNNLVNYYTKTAADARYQPLEDQRLSVANNVEFAGVNASALSLRSQNTLYKHTFVARGLTNFRFDTLRDKSGTVAYLSDTLTGQLATKTDLEPLATASSVNAALALKENSITPSNTVSRYWNGYKNFVQLLSDSITEGGKLFYTDSRARQAISLTTTGSGAATYNNSTGVLNVPTNTGFDTTVTRQPFTFLGRKSGTGGWSQQQYFDTTWFNGLFASYVRAAQNNSSVAGGSDGQVQFNSSGSLAGSSNLTYNSSTNVLTFGNTAGTSGQFRIDGIANSSYPFSVYSSNGLRFAVDGFGGVVTGASILAGTTVNAPSGLTIGASSNLSGGGLYCRKASSGGNIATFTANSGTNQLQIYDNGNVSIASSPTDNGLARLQITGNSLTISAATGIVSLSQTWNTTGSPTAILANITNTASGANANIIDLRVGGTSQFNVNKEGKISIATGTNKSVGFATLSSGTVTVNTTAVSANSGIQLSVQESGTNNGRLRISAKIAGTSFTITSSDSGDNCTVFYQIIN